jgi:hypothetical protein
VLKFFVKAKTMGVMMATADADADGDASFVDADFQCGIVLAMVM